MPDRTPVRRKRLESNNLITQAIIAFRRHPCIRRRPGFAVSGLQMRLYHGAICTISPRHDSTGKARPDLTPCCHASVLSGFCIVLPNRAIPPFLAWAARCQRRINAFFTGPSSHRRIHNLIHTRKLRARPPKFRVGRLSGCWCSNRFLGEHETC